MRIVGPIAGLILVLIGAVPAMIGVDFIHRSDDLTVIVLGVLLVIVFASVTGGGISLAALGTRASLPDHVRTALSRSISLFLGAALVTSGFFCFIVAVKLLSPEVLWSGAFFTLGAVSCALGSVSIHRCSKAGAWRPEPEIGIPVYQEDLPVVPPEPNLDGLLHLKKRLKERGRT